MIKLSKRQDQRDQRDAAALLLKDNATSAIAAFAVPDGPYACLIYFQLGVVYGRYSHGDVLPSWQSHTELDWKSLST